MNERSRGCFIAALPLVFAVFFPQTSFAQCSYAFDGILVVGDMPGSPFQADFQVKSLSSEESASSPRQERQEHIIRDSQGRVRIETRDVGTDDAATPAGHLHVVICDPVDGRKILLDTVNKVATVRKMDIHTRELRKRGTADNEYGHFCHWQLRIGINLNNSTVEDLGQRTIEGMEAQGSLERRPPLSERKNASPSAPKPTYTTETWCSEDLGADVQRVLGTVEKGTSRTATLTHIQRGEPDPALFQIPPGYHVIEREDRLGMDWRLAGNGL